MQVFAQPFWAPKGGSVDSEYEDAFWPDKETDTEVNCFCCAVADGATETSYSRIWAEQLVRYFCKGSADKLFTEDTFRALQEQWSAKVLGRPLPWYAEEKARLGAFAAVLGLVLRDGSDETGSSRNIGSWEATAIGDSCLVQMRGDEVLVRFPIDHSASFDSRPHLLSSNPMRNRSMDDHLRTEHGTWLRDDAFYLMTDALALWFMQELEAERSPWKILQDFGTSDEVCPFRAWVEKLRSQRAIRNDDVTLLRVNVM